MKRALSFFSLSGGSDHSGILPGFSSTETFTLTNDGSLGFKYKLSEINKSGDTAFCDALNTESDLGDVFTLSGSSDTSDVTVSFANSSSELQNKSCDLEFVFDAWQTDSDGAWGFRDSESVSINISSGGWVSESRVEPELPRVVINELMPDPSGNDRDYRPNGEWIELYNAGDQTVYLMGWYLTDGQNHDLILSSTNTTDESIPPHGFVVVYRNNDSSFSLNNSSTEETISLYDNNHVQRDSLQYGRAHDLEVSENKTVARYHDGAGDLFITIPTLGDQNVLEPVLTFTVTSDKHYASFKVSHLEIYSSLNYEIEYKKKTGPDELLSGSALLSGQADYEKTNIELGSCSSGGTCVFPEGVKDIKLTVTLHRSGDPDFILKSKID